MLEIQKFLRNSSLEELYNQFHLEIKNSSIYSNLYLFKYNQIKSPMGETICQEARGLILDQSNNWEIVSFPFRKFFNYGETHAAVIDWDSAQVFNKVDGSLITFYWYDNAWQVSTSGTPDAITKVQDFPFSFRDLVFSTMKDHGYQLPDEKFKNFCFMCELTSPFNKVVVSHKQNLTLLGARNLDTLQEISLNEAQKMFAIPAAQQYDLSNLSDIVDSFNNFSALDQEGYIVVDKNFNRLKIKHPDYFKYHKLKSGMCLKSCMALIMEGEKEELIACMPEYKEMADELEAKFQKLLATLVVLWDAAAGAPTRKEFAQRVSCHPARAVLFSRLDGRSDDLSSILRSYSPEKILLFIENLDKNENN